MVLGRLLGFWLVAARALLVVVIVVVVGAQTTRMRGTDDDLDGGRQ